MAGYLPDSGHARTKSIGSHGQSPVLRLTLRTNTKFRSACETGMTLGLGRTSDRQSAGSKWRTNDFPANQYQSLNP